MERRWVATAQVLCKTLRAVTAVMLLLPVVGCRVIDLRNPWEIYYDAERYGPEKENILQHFNMHRGRWWNYYTRGACYLEHGHYQRARDDFAKAIAVRGDIETRDARMYGMHFLDYFPHRETGIALYFEGTSKTGEGISEELLRQAKERLFEQAIAELTASLGQEESSRAKYYLNQARKALWRTSRNDRTPPVIRVKVPIYTNERIFRMGVTVTDDQSGVEEIRVRAPDGGIGIDRPRLLVELAQEEVTETVELTIDSQQKAAVVEIRAVDLAGNESDPHRVYITVDTQAPMAAVTILGAMQPQGRFAAFVTAVDDAGLREIQAGTDENDRFSCYGEKEYSGTVLGAPVGGELEIKVFDNAGNAVVASIPVGDSRGRASLSGTPWRQAPWMFPLMERIAVCDWNQRFSPAHLAEPSFYRPHSPVALYWGGHAQTASLASFSVLSANEATGQKQPQFHFPHHVRPPDGKPKETSQDSFVVEGTLRNAQGVTGIKVDGIDIDPDMLRRMPLQRGDDLLFSHTVDLARAPVDGERLIKVQYQVGGHWTETTLSVTRRNNCIRDPDAVYRAVLLLRVVSTAYRRTIFDGAIPKDIYDAVLASLKNLRARDPEPYCRQPLGRLGMHDVSSVFGITEYSVAQGKSVSDVLGVVGSRCDLILHGDIGLWAGRGVKEFQITLRAMDVMSKKDLQFSEAEKGASVVLAETYVPCRTWNERPDAEDWRENMDILAAQVGEKLPRVQAEVRVASAVTAAGTISISRGRDDMLFPAMSLCFYTYGDVARTRNVYLKKIGHGRIANLDRRSSQVRHQLDLAHVKSGLIAITK